MEATESKDPSTDSQFSSQNGFHSARFPVSDIEMTAASAEYTSLKDLLPTATSMSPTPSSSWHEIPIRNPLVKHAAMAYLQPMSTPTTSFGDGGGLLGKLKVVTCLCECGCFGWLCDVVSGTVKEMFGELVSDRKRIRRTRDSEEEDEDEDEDEDEYEDDEKVD